MTMWRWFFLAALLAAPTQAPTAARSAEVDYYTEYWCYHGWSTINDPQSPINDCIGDGSTFNIIQYTINYVTRSIAINETSISLYLKDGISYWGERVQSAILSDCTIVDAKNWGCDKGSDQPKEISQMSNGILTMSTHFVRGPNIHMLDYYLHKFITTITSTYCSYDSRNHYAKCP